MSFWNLNDGTEAQASQTFEIEGGDLAPIPDNTDALSAIEEAKWAMYEGDHYVSLKWRIAAPEQYARRVVFQKLFVFGKAGDKDKKATSDRAKRMLAAIDTNAGGRLLKLNNEPSDDDLMAALAGKMMAIKLKVWKMNNNGEEKTGNWICAVAPAKRQSAQPVPAPSRQQSRQDFSEDDVPF